MKKTTALFFIYFIGIILSYSQIIDYNSEDETTDTIGKTYSPMLDNSEDGYRLYIEHNLIMPRNTLSIGTAMEVIVSFVVKKDSQIKRFKIEQNTHPQNNLYIEQIHHDMPNWEPGMKDGKIKNFKMYYGFRITRSSQFDLTVEKLEISAYKGKKISKNLKIIILTTALATALYLFIAR